MQGRISKIYGRKIKRNGKEQERMCASKRRKRYIFDLVLICVLLAVCLSVYFFIYKKSGTGAYATVYVGDEIVSRYSLDVDGEYVIGDGGNILTIEDGEVFMTYADCPDGWCKKQGRISLSGERITCLPNRVMIMITGAAYG